MITKEQFESYEAVRVSGVTNMWAIRVVCSISDLSREQCLEIISNYSVLADKYLTNK